MKNLFRVPFAMLLASILLVSCSKEESLKESETLQVEGLVNDFQSRGNSDDFENLKVQFQNLLVSPEYNTYKNSVHVNLEKLPEDQNLNFIDKDDYIGWIEDNLSNTDFSSVDEALTLYDENVYLFTEFLNKDLNLFERISNLEIEKQNEIYDLMTTDLFGRYTQDPFGDVGMDDCMQCIHTMAECYRDAKDKYNEIIGGSAAVWAFGGGLGGAAISFVANTNMTFEMRSCAREGIRCKQKYCIY